METSRTVDDLHSRIRMSMNLNIFKETNSKCILVVKLQIFTAENMAKFFKIRSRECNDITSKHRFKVSGFVILKSVNGRFFSHKNEHSC